MSHVFHRVMSRTLPRAVRAEGVWIEDAEGRRGYFPFAFAACTSEVFETVRRTGFVHGFRWSHNGVGAAVADAALRRLSEDDLVEAGARQGERLLKSLSSALEDDPSVGDGRGIGLMVGSSSSPTVRAGRRSRANVRRPSGSSRRPGTRDCSCTRARASTGATATS